MNLLEYRAKELLSGAGLYVPRSWLVKKNGVLPPDATYPLIAKSQVPVGGRGKAGGIIVVEAAEDLPGTLDELFGLDIKGHVPDAVLLEERLDVGRELYLALRLNRDMRQVEWLVSATGGVDIEENAAAVTTLTLDDGSTAQIAELLGAPIETISPLLSALERCFFDNDILLLEINPLILTTSGRLVCADAKVTVDDNARFRQPGLPWPEATGNPPLALGGNIGCIANGAGMAMSTMDAVVAMGGCPANFLDIGGGTGEKEFVTALGQVAKLPGVTSIIINIFAGISRCDEIARGIIAAKAQLSDLPPLFIRLEGTNRDIAMELLGEAGIATEPDLKSCVQKALARVASPRDSHAAIIGEQSVGHGDDRTRDDGDRS